MHLVLEVLNVIALFDIHKLAKFETELEGRV